MAKTIDELKSAAAVVRDATEEKENTATRVGQLLIDMIDTLSESVSVNGIKGYVSISSTDDLPEDPTTEQQQNAYLLDTTLYVYVGTGGDTLDGKYQSAQLKGEDGDQGGDGVGFDDASTPTPVDGTAIIHLTNGDNIILNLNHVHPQYQALLVSGTNIKTINNESLLGSGNISISGGGNVQPDWQQSDSTASDYIKNKPSIPTVPTNVSAFSNDAQYLKYQLVSTLPASPDSGTLYLIAESE